MMHDVGPPRARPGIGTAVGGRMYEMPHARSLVHDYLLVLRGAERTFAAMADVWPEAPDRHAALRRGGHRGALRRALRADLAAPAARAPSSATSAPCCRCCPSPPPPCRSTSHDVVVSSSSAFAHGVRRPPGALHLCYCHSPFRYAWHERDARAGRGARRRCARPCAALLRRHRAFDRRAAGRVDRYLANAQLTRERIRRFWGRDSVVVHPPVDVERFALGRAGRARALRRRAGRPQARRGGDRGRGRGRPARSGSWARGPELERLEARFGGRARSSSGACRDEELARVYAEAAALVVPNVEEFGIAAVEAQAAGRPVVAVDAGGARETVRRRAHRAARPATATATRSRGPCASDLSRFDPPRSAGTRSASRARRSRSGSPPRSTR